MVPEPCTEGYGIKMGAKIIQGVFRLQKNCSSCNKPLDPYTIAFPQEGEEVWICCECDTWNKIVVIADELKTEG